MHQTPLLQSYCLCLLFTSTSVAWFCARQPLLRAVMLNLTRSKIQECPETNISFECKLWPPQPSGGFTSPASVEETYLTLLLLTCTNSEDPQREGADGGPALQLHLSRQQL